MFVVELEFSDDPARLALRPQHRERLGLLHASGQLAMGGPWADESGSMLLFDVADEKAVQEILDQDPYYRTGGVTIRGIREWNLVVG
jgi:uncharacterized protein YciI